MTIRLLCAYDKYPANAIITLDAGTEAGLISAKVASATLTGGTVYFAPVPAMRQPQPLLGGGCGSINANEQITIQLPEGQALTVTGTAATGTVQRIGATGANIGSPWAIGTGTLSPIGPFSGTQQFLISCSAGSVAVSVGDAVLGLQIGAQGRRLVTIGDSLLGQGYTAEYPANCDPTSLDTTISARSTRARGIVPVLNALMGMPFVPVYYGAVTGTTTNTILASADRIFNRAFEVVVEDGGTNDASLYATEWGTLAAAEDGIVANRQSVWAKAIAAGAKCIIALAIPPVGSAAGWTTAQKAMVVRANARLAKAAAPNTCVIWIDMHSALVDPTLSTGLAKTNVLFDNDKHEGGYGAYLIAQKILQDSRVSSLACKRQMLSSQLDCIQNDASSKNLLNASVGLATGATGASGGAGSSGTILNGITTGCTVGSPNTVASIVAAPNGVGNAQRLEITSFALNDQVRMLVLPGSTLTEFPKGSWGYFECMCKVTGATNLVAVTITAGATWVGGSLSSQTAAGLTYQSGEAGSAYTNNDVLTLVSEPFYMPADITSMTFNKGEVFATFGGAGGATLDIYQIRWVKL